MKQDKRSFPKLLIVEGEDDKFAVIELMKHHTNWPTGTGTWPVYIETAGGVDEILKASYLNTEFKASGLKTLGVILDADAGTSGRYELVKQRFTEGIVYPEGILPEDGLAGVYC